MAITVRFSHTYLGVNLSQLPTVFAFHQSLTPIDTPQGGGNQQGGSWDLRPPRVIDKLEGTRMTPWSPFWTLIDLSWSTILTRSSTELPPTISIWMIHFFGWRRRSWNCLVVYRKMRSFFQSSSLTMNRIELLRATATACWHHRRGPTSRRPDGRDLSDGGTLRYVGTTRKKTDPWWSIWQHNERVMMTLVWNLMKQDPFQRTPDFFTDYCITSLYNSLSNALFTYVRWLPPQCQKRTENIWHLL